MKLEITENDKLIFEVDHLRYAFQMKNLGNNPEVLLISPRNFKKLKEIVEQQLGILDHLNHPFRIFGIKIVRSIDIEDNYIEVF